MIFCLLTIVKAIPQGWILSPKVTDVCLCGPSTVLPLSHLPCTLQQQRWVISSCIPFFFSQRERKKKVTLTPVVQYLLKMQKQKKEKKFYLEAKMGVKEFNSVVIITVCQVLVSSNFINLWKANSSVTEADYCILRSTLTLDVVCHLFPTFPSVQPLTIDIMGRIPQRWYISYLLFY